MFRIPVVAEWRLAPWDVVADLVEHSRRISVMLSVERVSAGLIGGLVTRRTSLVVGHLQVGAWSKGALDRPEASSQQIAIHGS